MLLITLLYTCWTLLGSTYDDYALLEPGWIIVTFQGNADVFCKAPKITAVIPFKGEIHLGFYGEYSYETTGQILAEAPRWQAAIVSSPSILFIESTGKVLISPRAVR